jgi:hypothetical protein
LTAVPPAAFVAEAERLTLIALIVKVTELVRVLSATEVAVMVTVQLAALIDAD